MQLIQPLKNNWKIEEDLGISIEQQVLNRVNSEDNYTNAKGYPLIKEEDIIKVKR